MNPMANNSGAWMVSKRSVAPQALSAGAVNGAAVQRAAAQGGQLALSCKLVAQTGAVTGAPTGQTLDAKLQDSADGSTGWADYVPPRGGSASINQITAVNTIGEVNIDLSNARAYVRAVATAGFTGGTSPTLLASVEILLGGTDNLPAA